jgi:uncharacterized protein YkwD
MRQELKRIALAGLFGGLTIAFGFIVSQHTSKVQQERRVEVISTAVAQQIIAHPEGMKAKGLFEMADQERNGKLKWNECMAKQAEKRAQEIVETKYFEHDDGTGKLPYRKMIDQCFYWLEAGENLAKGYETTTAAHAALMASPTHKANIMNKNYHQMGVGCYDIVCVEFFAN